MGEHRFEVIRGRFGEVWRKTFLTQNLIFHLLSCNFAVKKQWHMTYLNQFHKESAERKMRKIAESMKSPMNSTAAAAYMKANFEKAKSM